MAQLNYILDSENFGEAGRNYFLDIKLARNRTRYLRITRSDASHETEGYKRTQLILFEEDLRFFVEALSMVLGRFAAGEASSK